MELPASEISVIVQGPVYGPAHEHLTRRALESARRQLPGCETILSTWVGTDVAGLAYDRLVLSEDPGGVPQAHDPRFFFNVNRQIVSTSAGLRAATRPYALKLRSDMLLTGTGFRAFFHRFPRRHREYALFSQRVITGPAANPHRHAALFMPGDWFSFGLLEDVRMLWEVPLAPEPETSRYFELHPEEHAAGERELCRYNPEQYIWVQALAKRFEIPFRHALDFSPGVLRIAELALVDNLIPLEPEAIGLATPRHTVSLGAQAAWYTHGEWRRLYQRYCDPAARVPPDMAQWRRRLIVHGLRVRERWLGKYSGLRSLPPRAR